MAPALRPAITLAAMSDAVGPPSATARQSIVSVDHMIV